MTVRCSSGHENEDGSLYCDTCGEPLPASGAPAATADSGAPQVAPTVPAAAAPDTVVCPSCGATNPAGEAFCSNCGSMLGAPPVADTSTPAPAVSVAPSPAPTPEPAVASAPAALNARLIVEADNQEFDLSGKDNILIG